MAKFYSAENTFNYHFDQVLQAFWRRYPNPYSSHVLSEDTIFREVKKDGKLYSKRLLTKTNKVPNWGKKFFKAKFVCIVEESVVDPKAKTLITYTRNIGFNKIMNVVEKVIYRTSTDQPGKTIAMRSAWIDSQVFGFSNVLRTFGCERFKKNCNKTILGFNHVLEMLFPFHNATNSMNKENVTQKFKEAAKTAGERAKAQAEQIYQVYSVQN
jgi:hypothetical protein